MENEELLAGGTNPQQEENLEEIEITEEEIDLALDEVQEEEEEKIEPPIVNKDNAPKLLKERKELKNENLSLKEEVALLRFENDLVKLEKQYWDVNVEELKEFKEQPQYKSLPLEDVYLLYKAKQPKEERRQSMWVVGTRWTPIVKYITSDKLDDIASNKSQEEYNKVREMISAWKLYIKN